MNEVAFDSLKGFLSKILPQSLRTAIKKARIFLLRGSHFYCPVCERSFCKFLESGVNSRRNSRCPCCGSLERHRLLWVALRYLQDKGVIKWGGRLLHIAPESCLAERFGQEYDYLSIDLDGKKAMMAMDITTMTFKDESFDVIVCNHVLEHIPDDEKAMKELYRVLKHGGWASIQVPIKGKVTQEDLSVTDPKERRRLYGQEDHVRYYGLDYVNQLKDVGFDTLLIQKSDLLEIDDQARMSLSVENEVILCRK